MRNQLAGTIVHGAVRDLDDLHTVNYPLFSVATNAVSGKNRTKLVAVNAPVTLGKLTVQPGDWLFGDSSAVLCLPKDKFDLILDRAEKISMTESKISSAIASGMELAKARELFNYREPWKCYE